MPTHEGDEARKEIAERNGDNDKQLHRNLPPERESRRGPPSRTLAPYLKSPRPQSERERGRLSPIDGG